MALFVSLLWLLALVTYAQPLSDNFANRAAFPGHNLTITGSLVNATAEAGEPIFPGVSSGQTAWWTWTAPHHGNVTLTVAGRGFSPFVTVHTGNELAGLSLIASNNHVVCYARTECGCHWRMRRQSTFHVARGEAYHFAIDSAILTDTSYKMVGVRFGDITAHGWQPIASTNVIPAGVFELELRFTPAPLNDDFEGRVELRGSRVHIAASNEGATRQAGESDHLGNRGGSSVWYSWRAPASGRVTLSQVEIQRYPPPSTYGLVSTMATGQPDCGREIDQNPPAVFFPVFAAYKGDAIESLVPAGCLNLPLMNSPHAVAFDAIKGETYQIAFDGNLGTTGRVPLYLALTTPASNDDFKRRIKLHGIDVIATGYNAGATRESGEPVPPAHSSGKTVWWSWIAPVSGTTSLSVAGSDFSFPISVFNGPTVSSLQVVATTPGNVSFEAAAGQTYEIAVGDVDGLTGAIKLTMQAPVVAAILEQVLNGRGKMAVLRYAAVPGQKILLQRSYDGTHWENRRTVLARREFVDFLVALPSTGGSPSYRAIIADMVLR